MEQARIHLQGLNYRTSDRDVTPGMCRTLHNLYPRGSPEATTWLPVNQPTVFHTPPGGTKYTPMLDFFVWHRANLPSYLVYLMQGNVDPGVGYPNDELRMMRLTDVSGDTTGPAVESDKLLFSLTGVNNERQAFFAQIGDNLVISILNGETSEELLIAFASEGVTYCSPYNLPELPVLSITLLGNITFKIESGVFAYRYGYELNDGSVVRLSAPKIGPLVATPVFSTGARFAISVPVVDLTLRKLVKGVAVYVTPMVPVPDVTQVQIIQDKVFKESLYYYIGVVKNVWQIGTEDVFYKQDNDELLTLPLLDEDNLASHRILGAVPFSYNKLLLLGDAAYDFVLPARADGLTNVTEGIVPAVPPSEAKAIQTDETHITLTWIDAPNTSKVILHRKRILAYTVVLDDDAFPVEIPENTSPMAEVLVGIQTYVQDITDYQRLLDTYNDVSYANPRNVNGTISVQYGFQTLDVYGQLSQILWIEPLTVIRD